MKSTLYQDYDALAYKPHNLGEERGAINHIKKTKQKTKGLEIVFDPKGHKEFVTGFRKRKQQRRKVANQQLEKKAKQQRLESRAERRKEMKHQLGLPEDYGIADSDGEQGGGGGDDDAAAAAAAAKSEVKQYQQAGYTTTVSITNFNAGYDDSDEEPAEAADSGDGDDNQANPQQQQQRQQQSHSKHKSSVKHGNVGKKTGSKSKSSKKHHGRKK